MTAASGEASQLSIPVRPISSSDDADRRRQTEEEEQHFWVFGQIPEEVVD